MKILLIGGAGFIGLNLISALLQDGHEIQIADCIKTPTIIQHQLSDIQAYHIIESGDIELLIDKIDKNGIECVISLASSMIPSSDINDLVFEFEKLSLPTFRLMEQLAIRNIRFAYFSSGGTVYGDDENLRFSEDDPLRPINHYGCAKVLFETYLDFLARTKHLKFLIFRPSNPFGPYQNPLRKQGLIAVAVDKILHGKPIEIWGDGSVVRDYIWIEDLAGAIASLIRTEKAWGQIFNIGSGVGHSVNDLLKIIQELAGKTVEVHYRESRTVDVKRVVLDISRLRSTVPFEPLELRIAIERYLRML